MKLWRAWPFVFAPHRRVGYTNILVPGLLLDMGMPRDMIFILAALSAERGEETPPGSAYTLRVDGPGQPLCVVFRTWHVRHPDGRPLTDRSRRVPLTEGVVLAGRPPYRVAVRALLAAEEVTRAAFWARWKDEQAWGWPKDSAPLEIPAGRQEDEPPTVHTRLVPLGALPVTALSESRLAEARRDALRTGVWDPATHRPAARRPAEPPPRSGDPDPPSDPPRRRGCLPAVLLTLATVGAVLCLFVLLR